MPQGFAERGIQSVHRAVPSATVYSLSSPTHSFTVASHLSHVPPLSAGKSSGTQGDRKGLMLAEALADEQIKGSFRRLKFIAFTLQAFHFLRGS